MDRQSFACTMLAAIATAYMGEYVAVVVKQLPYAHGSASWQDGRFIIKLQPSQLGIGGDSHCDVFWHELAHLKLQHVVKGRQYQEVSSNVGERKLHDYIWRQREIDADAEAARLAAEFERKEGKTLTAWVNGYLKTVNLPTYPTG